MGKNAVGSFRFISILAICKHNSLLCLQEVEFKQIPTTPTFPTPHSFQPHNQRSCSYHWVQKSIFSFQNFIFSHLSWALILFPMKHTCVHSSNTFNLKFPVIVWRQLFMFSSIKNITFFKVQNISICKQPFFYSSKFLGITATHFRY